MEKMKLFLKKSSVLCCALMAAPMAAMAQETTTSGSPLSDMVKTISLSDATAAIAAAAGVLIGLAVLVYGAKKVIGFFSR